ncbi:MAG: hypothetical protein LBT93_07340 [Treponema sp.]|jgi:hypothetical protein|nr:hypothetical protein [Treponema sp.]
MKFIKQTAAAFVFGLVIIGGIFAQEKQAFIKPTFSFGFATAEGETLAANAMDIDFINDFGLTLGLQGLFAWNNNVVANPVAVGLGYTYNAGKWIAGAKLMAVPLFDVGGVGIDVNGTYWWKENLGFTGILDLYFPKGFTIFSLRVGVTFKY